ncbi:MAG: hypothetical protein EKK52_07790 [Burkholderiales bacterium]|nr:MAG: hypothetical protein EKK52_07790 [Burkholderiales bacterium]
MFNATMLSTGLAIFDGGERDAPFYRLPTRDADSPVPGLGSGAFYSAHEADAGRRASVDAAYADAEDLRFTPQVVARGHAGPLTRDVIHGVFGFSVQSQFSPRTDHMDLDFRQDRSVLGAEMARFWQADALPTCCLMDYINHRADWFWLLEKPEHIRWSDARKRQYDEAARAFAHTVGGRADAQPLLQAFALPGACEVVDHGGGWSTNTPVHVFSPALAMPDRLPPRYGRSFDDLMPLANRIAATPSIPL